MGIIHRLLWQIAYARIALRSRFDFTPWSAWAEAGASWEMNNDERGDETMPTPSEAFSQDAYEWVCG